MKRKIISVITTFVLILSSHFSMIYALDKPHLNLNEKEDSVEVTLNLPKVENGLDAFSGKIDYDHNKLELVKVKQVSKKFKTPEYNEKFILLINSKTINESVDAVCFTFKVKKNVTGDTTVKVTKLTGSTSKNQKINLDDVQTVFTTDKKENKSNTGNGSNSSNTSKDNGSKNDTNKSNTSNKPNDSHKNSDGKNTSKQNKVSSNDSLSKEETKKDTDTNKTTSSEDKTSSNEDERSVLQDDSKQKKEKGNKKNINGKQIVEKKEQIYPKILIVVALLISLLLLYLRKKK